MAAAGVIYLTPNEAFASVHVGSGLYTGDMKFQRRELPIIMTRIASLMRDPEVQVQIISENEAQNRRDLEEALIKGEIDAPCVDLVKKLNELPGLYTSECCSGHGRSPFSIWLHVRANDQRGLFVLARSISPRYWQFGWDWTLDLPDVGDIPPIERALCYRLHTKHRDEALATQQAVSLVENIDYHLAHKAFREAFLPTT